MNFLVNCGMLVQSLTSEVIVIKRATSVSTQTCQRINLATSGGSPASDGGSGGREGSALNGFND